MMCLGHFYLKPVFSLIVSFQSICVVGGCGWNMSNLAIITLKLPYLPHIILFSHISHIWLKNGSMTPSLSPEKSEPKLNSV